MHERRGGHAAWQTGRNVACCKDRSRHRPGHNWAHRRRRNHSSARKLRPGHSLAHRRRRNRNSARKLARNMRGRHGERHNGLAAWQTDHNVVCCKDRSKHQHTHNWARRHPHNRSLARSSRSHTRNWAHNHRNRLQTGQRTHWRSRHCRVRSRRRGSASKAKSDVSSGRLLKKRENTWPTLAGVRLARTIIMVVPVRSLNAVSQEVVAKAPLDTYAYRRPNQTRFTSLSIFPTHHKLPVRGFLIASISSISFCNLHPQRPWF